MGRVILKIWKGSVVRGHTCRSCIRIRCRPRIQYLQIPAKVNTKFSSSPDRCKLRLISTLCTISRVKRAELAIYCKSTGEVPDYNTQGIGRFPFDESWTNYRVENCRMRYKSLQFQGHWSVLAILRCLLWIDSGYQPRHSVIIALISSFPT